VVAAFLLTGLFRQHVETELAQRMQGHLEDLIGALARAQDGTVIVSRELAEPLFRKPYSGFYWIVQRPDGSLLRSRSLWDHSLDLAPLSTVTTEHLERIEAEGPREQPLLAWARQVRLAGDEGPFTVAVGADVTQLEAMTRSFARTLGISLAVLAAGLMAAAVLQVRLGLRPLRRLREALLALRAGRATRVVGAYPSEVQPLVDDLNALLEENSEIVERARTQTGNFAHALKTPLAVITNASAKVPGPEGELIRAQADRMRRQTELHLVRARAAATAKSRGEGTPIRPAVDDLLRTIERLYGDRNISITVRQDKPAVFRGEAHELHEMLGNLLDNAGKWARSQVLVSITAPDKRIVCEIEDDGPGIAKAHRASVLQRGQRLDESHSGAGLGLAIVDDLARLYGGSLTLDSSRLGGLRVRLELPAA
jgi:signal transduction histidine kinase